MYITYTSAEKKICHSSEQYIYRDVVFQISCFFLMFSFLNMFNCHKDAAVQRNTIKVAELWSHSADMSRATTEKLASNSIYFKQNKTKI